MREERVGALLFAVLVCIGVTLALMLAALQTSLNQRRQLSRELQMEQTRLLLNAAIRSEAVEDWRKSLANTDAPDPLEITVRLPIGKQATVTAVKPDETNVTLMAMIGDVENPISQTRRSGLLKQED